MHFVARATLQSKSLLPRSTCIWRRSRRAPIPGEDRISTRDRSTMRCDGSLSERCLRSNASSGWTRGSAGSEAHSTSGSMDQAFMGNTKGLRIHGHCTSSAVYRTGGAAALATGGKKAYACRVPLSVLRQVGLVRMGKSHRTGRNSTDNTARFPHETRRSWRDTRQDTRTRKPRPKNHRFRFSCIRFLPKIPL